MKFLYLTGVVIQLIGYFVAGIILIKLLARMSGFAMMWWEWLILLALAPCARYLLREGFNLCIMSINEQRNDD